MKLLLVEHTEFKNILKLKFFNKNEYVNNFTRLIQHLSEKQCPII